MLVFTRHEGGPQLSEQELVIPSWRQTRRHLYQNPAQLSREPGGRGRERSLPPRVWSAAHNQARVNNADMGLLSVSGGD